MVTKLHIDFNQPLKQKDRLISFFSSRKTTAGLIILFIIIWMAPGLLGNKKEEKETVKQEDTQKVFVVSAQKVQNRDTFKVVRASGVLKPVYEIDVLSKKDGEVKDIVKQRGQLIKNNDIMGLTKENKSWNLTLHSFCNVILAPSKLLKTEKKIRFPPLL